MKISRQTAISLFSVVLATGCGGGGSSSTTYPIGSVHITSATAQNVAATGVNSSNQVGQTGSQASTSVRSTGGIPKKGNSNNKLSGAANIARAYYEKVLAQINASSARAIPVQDISSTSCSSGTAILSFTDVNNNSNFDIGDTATTTYTACVEPYSAATLNGELSVSISELSSTQTTAHVKIDTTFNNYSSQSGTATVTFAGDMALTIDVTSTTVRMKVSGSSLNTVSTVDGTSLMTDYSLTMTDTSTQTSISIGMMVDNSQLDNGNGGTIYIYTPTPLSDDYSCGNFNSGALRINGSNGSYLLLTANSDCSVTITGSDGTTSITPVNTTWDAL